MRTIIAFMLFLGLSYAGIGQCINGTKSLPIHKVGGELVAQLDDEGFEIVRIEYDLIFTSKDTYRYLHSDWEYVIFAFADEGVKDLDLSVYRYDEASKKWIEVATDSEADNTPYVSVQPSQTEQYKVTITVHEFHEGYTAARYGLLIFHD